MEQADKLYYEVRTMPVLGPPMPVAADIARHLQSRQYLGTTVVVCQHPLAMLSSTRKQWLRLARNLQKQRSSTLNAEEILRFTHSMMHMQHLQFAAKAPTEHVEAHIFFVTPEELAILPPSCQSLYITTPPPAAKLQEWVQTLAPDALVIDYGVGLKLDELGLEPKECMESRMLENWEELRVYLHKHGVNITELTNGGFASSTKMDKALDALLNAGTDFLRRAAVFQHFISLSQPLTVAGQKQREQFSLVMRLAHRVQSLTPGIFSNHLARLFGDHNAESFFLRDAAPEDDETIEQANLMRKHTYTVYYDMQNVPLHTIYI